MSITPGISEYEVRRVALMGDVVLFGSRARGGARERSDFDIGLLGPRPVPATLLARLQDELESLPTLIRFDVVDLGRANAVFRDAALDGAEVLLE